eukprot:7020382-Prymnesium_polylepis.1
MHPGHPPLRNTALTACLEAGTTEFTPEPPGEISASTTSAHGTTSKSRKANSSGRAPLWGNWPPRH